MKTQIFTFFILGLIACTNTNRKSEIASKSLSTDTVIKHDNVIIDNNVDWQKSFGLTHDPAIDSVWGKPVKFYIENPKCSPIAIDFYQGQFRPTDNNTTGALLNLVTTDDNNLRPFYRWCLNKTIQIQDGALGEYTGVPARRYAEKFPKEFFVYMDSDTKNDKYGDWVNSILYSGFYDNEDDSKPKIVRENLIKKMRHNCTGCSDSTYRRIEKLAKDCFP